MTIHIFCLYSSSSLDTKTHSANPAVHTEMRIYVFNYQLGQRAIASQCDDHTHTQHTVQTLTHTQTFVFKHKNTDTDTDKHRHTDTQTHRHTDTQTQTNNDVKRKTQQQCCQS